MKINDLNSYPQSEVPVTGPAGTLFQDSVFGTPILRVTDENDPQSNNGFSPQYSAIYEFANADSSCINYEGGDGWHWIADVDVAKRTVSNKRRLAKSGPTYWSRTDPNVLYVIETWNCANLWKYEVKADTWTLLVDLSVLVPTIVKPDTSWIGNRGMSWEDDRFHFSCPNADIVLVYSRKSGIVGQVTLAQAQAKYPGLTAYSFGKSTLDASGKLILTASEELLINIETLDMFSPGFGTPPNIYGDVHPDFGSSGMGCGGLGGIDDTGFWPGIVKIDPSNLSTYLSGRTRIGPRALWSIDVHASFRRKDQAWLTITQDGGPPTGADSGKVGIFGDNEVFQIAPDSPPDGSKNRRLFQHHSDAISVAGSYQYADSARACDSQDGRIVGFNSTYGNKRTDVYLAFLEESPPVFTNDEIMKLKKFSSLLQ